MSLKHVHTLQVLNYPRAARTLITRTRGPAQYTPTYTQAYVLPRFLDSLLA